MKTSLFTNAFFAIFSLSFINTTYATVGGPTHIYDFTYSHTDESVYYKVADQSGRGCPTMLDKIFLETEQVSDFYSCDDGEATVQSFYNPSAPNSDYYPGGLEQVNKDIAEIIKNFKPLTPIFLKNSNIQIDVRFVSKKFYTVPDQNDFSHSVFIADVYQNNVKVDEFEVTGCAQEQPFLFQGYAIPGFNKKIIILSSTKGECAEGGYVREKLHVIGGVDNIDKTPVPSFYKNSRELNQGDSTLLVFEKDSIIVPATTTPAYEPIETPSKSFDWKLVMFALLILVVGFGLGKIKFGRSQSHDTQS